VIEAATEKRDEMAEAGHSPWGDAWHRLRRNRLALAGALYVIALALLCLVGPTLFHLSYEAQGLSATYLPPGAPFIRIFDAGHLSEPAEYTVLGQMRQRLEMPPGPQADAALRQLAAGREVTARSGDRMEIYRPGHAWLGTDNLGHDQFAEILYGGRISLMVGLIATFVALVIGVTYGAVAGFAGGKTDAVMMRIVDIIYALPFTIFVILLMVFFGQNIFLLFFAIGAVEWLTMARIVRGQVLTVKKMEYIEAARALGFGRRRIIFRHIIPNILGPIIVYTTLTIPAVMLLEAFLSFLGLGVQPPMSSWGVLIKDGADRMEEYWWLLVFPGVIFSLTLFSLNFLGDGLRDALDVRAAKD
jgi:oligopeptide transport system permease protein